MSKIDEIIPKIKELLKENPKSVRNISTQIYGRRKLRDRRQTSPIIRWALIKLLRQGKVRKTQFGNKYELII